MMGEILTIARRNGFNLPVAAIHDLDDAAKATGVRHGAGKVPPGGGNGES
ncbi:hypothetical protein [Propionivibrio sp.]